MAEFQSQDSFINVPGICSFMYIPIGHVESVPIPILGAVKTIFVKPDKEFYNGSFTEESSDFTENKKSEQSGTWFEYEFSGLIPRDRLELRNHLEELDQTKLILIAKDNNGTLRILGDTDNGVKMATSLSKNPKNAYTVQFTWKSRYRAYFMPEFASQIANFTPEFVSLDLTNTAFVGDEIIATLTIENTGTVGGELFVNFIWGAASKLKAVNIAAGETLQVTSKHTAAGNNLGNLTLQAAADSYFDESAIVNVKAYFAQRDAGAALLSNNSQIYLLDNSIQIDETTIINSGTAVLKVLDNKIAVNTAGTLFKIEFKDTSGNNYLFVFTEKFGNYLINVASTGNEEPAIITNASWTTQNENFHIWTQGGTKLFNADNENEFVLIPNKITT